MWLTISLKSTEWIVTDREHNVLLRTFFNAFIEMEWVCFQTIQSFESQIASVLCINLCDQNEFSAWFLNLWIFSYDFINHPLKFNNKNFNRIICSWFQKINLHSLSEISSEEKKVWKKLWASRIAYQERATSLFKYRSFPDGQF